MQRPDDGFSLISVSWRVLRIGLACLVIVAAAPALAALPPRLALVIGNAAYPSRLLPSSANDAALVAETLAVAGFEVTAVADADHATLTKAFDAFTAEAKQAGPTATIVVYLAGYGLQRGGENYVVPVDATITRDADVAGAAVRLADLMAPLEALPAIARLFLFDLARDNPFAKVGDMPLAGGLALAVAPKGSLYAFNTQPGAVAPREVSPYGAFARALFEMMLVPGLPLHTLFLKVRLRVGELTNGAAIPWGDDALDPSVTLPPSAAPVAPAPIAVPTDGLSASDAYSFAVAQDTFGGYLDFLRTFPQDRLAPRVRMIAATRREGLIFAAALRADEPRAYWTYMRRYPRGPHFFDVRRRLAALHAPLEPPPRFDIVSFPDLPPPPADELAVFDRSSIAFDDPDWPPIPVPPLSLLAPMSPRLVDGLPPPPVVPAGLLPIPMPMLATPARSPLVVHVSQKFAVRGDMVAQTAFGSGGDTTVTLTQAGSRVSKATMVASKEDPVVITQLGPDDAVLSRTTILSTAQGSTVVQTGPGGGVLTKAVSWTEPTGGRATLIRNGANQIVADIRRNDQGIAIASSGSDLPVVPRYPVAAQSPHATSPVVVPRVPERPALRDTLKTDAPLAASVTPRVSPLPAPAPIPGTPAAPSPRPAPSARTEGPTTVVAPLPVPRPAKPQKGGPGRARAIVKQKHRP